MTVTKFGSFEEARRALWVRAGDPSLASRIRNLWSFSSIDLPPRLVPLPISVTRR